MLARIEFRKGEGEILQGDAARLWRQAIEETSGYPGESVSGTEGKNTKSCDEGCRNRILRANLKPTFLFGQFRSLFDPPAAEHQIGVVEHRSLSGRHCPLRLIEVNLNAPIIRNRQQGSLSGDMLISDFDLRATRRSERCNGNPVHVFGH